VHDPIAGQTVVKQEFPHSVLQMLAFGAKQGLTASKIPATPAPLAISGTPEA
jgi:hypothetical protein